MAGAPFVPTPQEQALVSAILAVADPQKTGIVQGDVAVNILSGANLPPAKLGMIWQIADDENNGFLTRKGVGVAVRLLGHAQKGETVSEELLKKPGPLAVIKGIQPQLPSAPTSPVTKPQVPGSRLPSLLPDDRAKFLRMFNGFGPVQGLLSGEKAKEVFLKSKLPLEKLGQIWNLADTQMRGALDAIDFALGMYFIQVCMSQPNFVLPTSLPPWLYDQAGGKTPLDSVRSHMTGGSGRASPGLGNHPVSPLQPHHTGPIRNQYTGQPVAINHTGQSLLSNPPTSRLSMASSVGTLPQTPTHGASTAWDITPQEKATADGFFKGLDPGNRGYIEGDVAVPFMVKSQLPEMVLAQIWDLADLNKDGKLTQDGFAVAMHLINSKLLGKELPDVLPPSLLPPSHRPNAPQPQQTQPQKDLWLLDDTPPSSATDSHFNPSTISNATFATAQTTATTTPSLSRPSNLDLLSDDDSASTARVVPDHSVEIGNMENQLNSTNRSLAAAKSEREALEKAVGYSALTLSQLESQLASAKAGYETESKLLADLKERQATQATQIAKTREELIRAESDLSALRLEKSEIERTVLRDKEEVRDLQRNMKQVSEETELLKHDIDKVKKDTRHQKGLLAINRKQLATAEAEREKAEKELEAAKQELAEAEKEVLASEHALKQEETRTSFDLAFSEPTQVALPISPISTGTGSKNPFDKFTNAATGTPMAFTPFSMPPAETHEPSAVPVSSDPFGLASAFAGAPAPVASPPIPSEIPSPATQDIVALSPKPIEPPRSPSPVSLPPPTSAVEPSVAENKSPKAGLAAPSELSSQIDEAASHFPPLDNQDDNLETDLPPLREIIEEDDSSDDDSDDYEDARAHREAQTPEKAKNDTAVGAMSTVDSEDKKSLSPTPRALSPEATTSSTFDDVFGSVTTSSMVEVSPPHSHSAQASETAPPAEAQKADSPTKENPVPVSIQQPSSSPPPETTGSQQQSLAPLRGSLLDDAFGITGTKSSATSPDQFNFKSDFDGPFDFATFAPSTAPEVTNQSLATTGGGGTDPFGMPTATTTSPTLQAAPRGFSFEDAFPVQASQAQAPASAPAPAPAPQRQDSATFDDVFGITPDNFNDAYGFPPVPSTATQVQVQAQSNGFHPPLPNRPQNEISLPAYSPVTENLASPTARAQPLQRPVEPPRSRSPSDAAPSANSVSTPPRTRSPKPSAAASRQSRYEVPPPPADPPAKHSRFHLPLFGRSKTTKKPGRPKSPAPGRAVSTTSSASVNSGQEDAEGVKQIMDMGFTRNQAVVALEKYHYDVSRALNYLVEENAVQ